jgi:serine/threonine protein kinase
MPDANWVREYQDGEVVPGTAYRVVRLMGAGGMGSVYEVEQVEIGRRYVLKQLLGTLASREDLILRMEKEWKALGALEHPNVVDVVYAGRTADGIPYYVMELLVGETVRDRIEREGRISPGQAARIAQQTLLGLAAAHAVGVVHRDIKPANVFLTREGAVKVLDFGISYTESVRKITLEGHAIGTPRYMSPEQAAGEKADARSDLYAVGLLLYEMLAGEGPFDDLSEITQQMLAHLHRPPRPLSRFADVPAGLDAIVTRALSKNPSHRARTAEYMAAELAPFATSSSAPTPSIPSTSTPTPFFKSVWEHPTEELPKTRSPTTPVPASTSAAPIFTKSTTLGAAAIAVAIAATIFFGLTRSETQSTRSTAVTTAPSVIPTPTASPLSIPTPIPAANPIPIEAPTSSSSSPVSSVGPAPRSAASSHKPPPRLDAPPGDSIKLPPSGL